QFSPTGTLRSGASKRRCPLRRTRRVVSEGMQSLGETKLRFLLDHYIKIESGQPAFRNSMRTRPPLPRSAPTPQNGHGYRATAELRPNSGSALVGSRAPRSALSARAPDRSSQALGGRVQVFCFARRKIQLVAGDSP